MIMDSLRLVVMLTCAMALDPPLPGLRLELLQVVYRHGDRTPTRTFPNDPNAAVWRKMGLGQLTNVGKMQLYEFGFFLRNRYTADFLNTSYDREEVYVQSTDMDRTLMSALANMAGLYPPAGDQVWNPNLLWQPIPVHTLPTIADYVFDDVADCPRYRELYAAEMLTPEMRALDRNNKDLYEALTNVTGRKVNDINAVSTIYSNILAASCHNLTIPDWMNSSVSARMLVCHDLKFVYVAKTTEIQRLLGGPVWGRLLHNIRVKLNETSPSKRKAFLYASHDTVMSAAMSALGIFNDIAPPYAAALFVELFTNSSGSRFVQFSYKNQTSVEVPPFVLTVPGCSGQTPCPLETLVSLTRDVLSDDVVAECYTSTSTSTSSVRNRVKKPQ